MTKLDDAIRSMIEETARQERIDYRLLDAITAAACGQRVRAYPRAMNDAGYHLAPLGFEFCHGERESIPEYSSSVDACFEEDGPVAAAAYWGYRLREITFLPMQYDGTREVSVGYFDAGKDDGVWVHGYSRHSVDSAIANALCRAVITFAMARNPVPDTLAYMLALEKEEIQHDGRCPFTFGEGTQCCLARGHFPGHRSFDGKLSSPPTRQEHTQETAPTYYAPELSDFAGALAQVSHFAYEGRHRLEESPLSGLLLALDNLDDMRAEYERRSKDPRKDWLAVLGYLAERQAAQMKPYQPTDAPLDATR